MEIAVIGGGAMGSLYGGLLAHAGCPVTLIDGWEEHVAAIRENGLRLSGITGDIRADVQAMIEPQRQQFADLAIVLTNAMQTAVAAKTAKRILKPDGVVLTLQNGIGNVEALIAELGDGPVIGGLSYHSAALAGPGHSVHTHRGATYLGRIGGANDAAVDRVAETLARASFRPEIVGDMLGLIWTKFVHNCAINPVCAATGIRVGEIPTTPGADALQTRVVEETLAVIAAKGITLATADPLGEIKRFCQVKFNKPSMLQHIESGRTTEIDALNGAVVRLGRELGVPTPYSEALVWMVQAIQHQRSAARTGPPIDYEALEADAKRAQQAREAGDAGKS